jgi:hypothetical protein
MMCSNPKFGASQPIMGKAMKKFIVVAAFIAVQWQPANAQTILGSIPEEFRGDWCWLENTNEQIFKCGACKLKADSLSIDRMTIDRGRQSCLFDSGTTSAGVLNTPLIRVDVYRVADGPFVQVTLLH